MGFTHTLNRIRERTNAAELEQQRRQESQRQSQRFVFAQREQQNDRTFSGHEIPIARIVNGTPTNDFEAVGKIGDNTGFFCSGTLIGSRYVLTAAHCAIGVGNTQGRFQVGGKTYSTSQVYVHPNYNDRTLANDIAIYELNEDVTNVDAIDIFRGTPTVGSELTIVGFGAGGNGNSGHNGDYGTKRVGTTDIDYVENRIIAWDFDDNSESNTAPGDSGGPAFLQIAGEYQLAGVTSGGTRQDAGIGDYSYDTRVDAFQNWIDDIVGDGGGGGNDDDDDGGGGGGGDDHGNVPNATATAMKLTNNRGAGTGTFEEAGDRDVFKVNVTKTGRATIKLNGVGDVDTYLRVYDSNGRLVAQNDDYGNSLNSQVSLNVKKGTYYLSAGTYRDSETGDFRINYSQTTSGGNGDDHGNNFGSATAITLNNNGDRALNAKVEKGNDVDFFKFSAVSNGRMTINSRRSSGNLDTILTVYDSDRRRITFNDDHGNSLNSRVQFNVRNGEEYYVKLSSYGNTKGNYRLVLNQTTNRGRNRNSSQNQNGVDLNLSENNRQTALGEAVCLNLGQTENRGVYRHDQNRMRSLFSMMSGREQSLSSGLGGNGSNTGLACGGAIQS